MNLTQRRERLLVAVAGLILATASVTRAEVRYSVTDLGIGEAFAVNSSGVAVGAYSGSALLYDRGMVANLDPLGPGGRGWAEDINDSGQIVGWSEYSPLGGRRAVLWGSGTVTALLSPNAYESAACAINDHGQAVGYNWTTTEAGYPALWEDGAITNLNYRISPPLIPSRLGWWLCTANAINNAGQIAGQATYDQLGAYLYILQGDEAVFFVSLNGVIVEDISGTGQVVGYYVSQSGTGNPFGVLYSGGVLHNLGDWYPEGINSLGQVVGRMATPQGTHACIYWNGIKEDLNSLIDPGAGWTLWDATDINESGQIVGYGGYGAGPENAFLLTPIPEPATLSLLAAGLGAVWMGKRRATKGLRD